VLKYLNDPDNRVGDRVRQILSGYKTQPDAILNQTLADLGGGDPRRRGPALQSLSKAQIDGQRKAEVSRALNTCLDHPDCLRNGDLVAALDACVTKDNVPALIKVLDDSRFGNGNAIKLLAKTGDPDGLKAIGRAAGLPFNRNEATPVLKAAGIKGEQAVIEAMFTTKDNNVRHHYVRLLGEIGTRNVGGAALVQLVQ